MRWPKSSQAKAPFGGAQQVFAYLGRDTHRVGLSNARIQHVTERRTTFATKYGRSCTLEPVAFLRRLLLHGLPKGFHKIRHYGLCSSTHVARGRLALARRQLTPSPELEPCARSQDGRDDTSSQLDNRQTQAPQTWVEQLLALTGLDVRVCPRCAHGRMRIVPVPLDIVHAPPSEDSS